MNKLVLPIGDTFLFKNRAQHGKNSFRRIRNYLLDLGQDFEKICTSAGIPENAAVFHDPNARLSAENFLKLFFEAEKACGDPNFGLNLGREMARGYSGGSVLMNMMTNCPTMGAALDLFFRYHCLMADALQPYMVIENNLVKMRWETRGSDIHLPGQIVDTLLSFFSGILTVIAEGRMTLYEVRFNYPEPECLKPYEQMM